jgi:hypothetical protein
LDWDIGVNSNICPGEALCLVKKKKKSHWRHCHTLKRKKSAIVCFPLWLSQLLSLSHRFFPKVYEKKKKGRGPPITQDRRQGLEIESRERPKETMPSSMFAPAPIFFRWPSR